MAQNSLDRFFALLDREPRIAVYWDRERGLDTDAFEAALPLMSHGEAHMARFFVSLWVGGNGQTELFRFDLVDAVAILDPLQIKLIQSWMSDPFWP